MAAPVPPPRIRFTVLWIAGLSLLTGLMWSALLARVGPNLQQTSVFTPAAEGSELLRNLKDRYLIMRAVERRLTLMPFQPMLWEGPGDARGGRIHAMVMVPGLTHGDVIAGQSEHDRVIFRLSRHPNIPSALIHQRDGRALTLAEVRGSERWVVQESIISPERRSHLAQANYHHPNDTFRDVVGEFEGRWFEIDLAREGDRFVASVDGQEVARLADVEIPGGNWGLEGGDLPFVYLARLEINGEPVFEASGAWAAPGCRITALIGAALATAALLILLATLSWLLAPGLPWWVWLQRMIACGLVLAAVPAEVVVTHGIEFSYSLVAALRLSLIAAAVVWWLLLAGQGRHWRWQSTRLEDHSVVSALRANWLGLRPLGSLFAGIGHISVAAAVVVVILAPLPPASPDSLAVDLPIPGDGSLRRGDVLRQGEDGANFSSFWVRLTPREDPTSVELLARIGPHWGGQMRDWVALRLSTEPGQSGFLRSDVADSFREVDFALEPDQQVAVTLGMWGDECVARVIEGEIGRFRCEEFLGGDCALVIREGRVDITHARGSKADGVPMWGAKSFLRMADPIVIIPMVILIALTASAVLSHFLGSWLGISSRPLLRFAVSVSCIALVVFTTALSRIREEPPRPYGYHPSFALWCALLVATAGIYLWVAAHWSHLRRKWPALVVLTLAFPILIEAAVRSTPLRWTWLGDYQGGYIRDQYLVRPIQGPLMWMTASGDYQARNRAARPREYPGQNPEAFRIFCLGSSSTYGSGVEEAEDAWPSIVERMLSESVSGEIEVYNFGFPSLTSFDDLLFLERDLLALDPEWVVLSVLGNETICPHGNPPPQREQWNSHRALSPVQKKIRRALLHTRIVVGLNRWLRKVTTPRDKTHRLAQHPPEDFRDTLNEICDLAEEHGFGLTFIAEPMWERVVFDESRHEPWRAVMEEVAADRGVQLIDPVLAFTPHLADEMWATWIHPTESGNRVMAEAVAPSLAQALGDREAVGAELRVP